MKDHKKFCNERNSEPLPQAVGPRCLSPVFMESLPAGRSALIWMSGMIL